MSVIAVWIATNIGQVLFSVSYKPMNIDNTLFGALIATWELKEGQFYTSSYDDAKLGIQKKKSLIFILAYENISDAEATSSLNAIENAFKQQYTQVDFSKRMDTFILPDKYFEDFKATLQNILFTQSESKTYESAPVNYDHPVLRAVVARMINRTISPEEAKQKFIEVLGELPSLEEVRRIVHTVKVFLDEERAQERDFVRKLSEKMASWGQEAKVFIFGLDSAGKTAITNRVIGMGEEALNTVATQGREVKSFVKQNIGIHSWEGGGQKTFRRLWPKFLRNSNVLLFVVDGSEPDRFHEAKTEFYRLLKHDKENLSVAIAVNKSDLDNYIGSEFLIEYLELQKKLKDRRYDCFNTSALTGQGIQESLSWLVNQIIAELEALFI